MYRTSIRRAAIAAAAVGGLRATRRIATDRSDRRFMRVDPTRDTIHELGTLRFRLPAFWRRSDGLAAYYAADLEAVRALLPSPLLHPVRVDRDHGLVGIGAFRHFEAVARGADGSAIPLPPYGEVCVFVAVTRRQLPPTIPVLLGWAADRPIAGFVLHLPVTSRFHRDGGRSIWGMPKFLADMAFAEDGVSRSVALSEGGRSILELLVDVDGNARQSRAPSVLYGVRDGRLIETTMEARTFGQRGMRPRAELTLGDHPVARQLADLGLSERPMAGAIIVHGRFVMPEGRDLGPASTPQRFAGGDAETAAFTTRGADGLMIDHYAAPRPAPAAAPLTPWPTEVTAG